MSTHELSDNQRIDLLRTMILIRRFELKMIELYKQRSLSGAFLGALHSYEGQEAVSAGVSACLRDDDYIFSTHRGHGHALARKLDLRAVVAELLGKSTGCSRGRGGSMHLFDVEKGFMGGNGIVGGGLPLVLGTGYAARYQQSDKVTVCYFGDGAASQGSFHESLNMAAIHKLPILYVCENNMYAATTHVKWNSPLNHIAVRAEGYGIPGVSVDGNLVEDVHQAAADAVDRARAGNGPTLLECRTYRHRTHCMVIPEHRPRDEVECWKAYDPITLYEKVLQTDSIMTESDIAALHDDIQQQLEHAAQQALQDPLPDPDTVEDYVWAQ